MKMSRACHLTAPYLTQSWNTMASKKWKVPSLVGGSENLMRIHAAAVLSTSWRGIPHSRRKQYIRSSAALIEADLGLRHGTADQQGASGALTQGSGKSFYCGEPWTLKSKLFHVGASPDFFGQPCAGFAQWLCGTVGRAAEFSSWMEILKKS